MRVARVDPLHDWRQALLCALADIGSQQAFEVAPMQLEHRPDQERFEPVHNRDGKLGDIDPRIGLADPDNSVVRLNLDETCATAACLCSHRTIRCCQENGAHVHNFHDVPRHCWLFLTSVAPPYARDIDLNQLVPAQSQVFDVIEVEPNLLILIERPNR